MMNKNLTEMVFILDRSGSMYPLVNDTIEGYNSMINKQKDEKGEAFVTTVLFDTDYEILHDHINIKDIKDITKKDYIPIGLTALLDAVGKSINYIDAKISSMSEEERPGKVIFSITTDGLENASREFTKDIIKKMIEEKQSKEDWVFMFLGANIDAVGEAASLGINTDFARNYTANSVGTQSVYASMSKAMSCARGVEFSTSNINSDEYKSVLDSLDEIK